MQLYRPQPRCKQQEKVAVGGEIFARTDWKPFQWSPPTARPPALAPDHLSDAPARQAFTMGYWGTDFIFEDDGPVPRMATKNRWMLPKRWRIAGAFKTTRVERSRFATPPRERRSRDGSLAIFVNEDTAVETIRVPSVNEAPRYGLAMDGAWAKRGAEPHNIHPVNKVDWMRLSNEARYLAGILGMTGGLGRASQLLLHPFLQGIFSKLGGTPRLAAESVMPTVERLRKRAQRESAFDLKGEGERQALAELIVKAAQ